MTSHERASFDRRGLKLSREEIDAAEFLAARGAQVEAVPRSQGRTGDFLVNKAPTELKTAGPAGGRNQFLNQALAAKGQARNIIIDARTSGITKREAALRLRRIYQSDHTRGKVDSVTVILPDGTMLFGGPR